jgi:hypothetical protein
MRVPLEASHLQTSTDLTTLLERLMEATVVDVTSPMAPVVDVTTPMVPVVDMTTHVVPASSSEFFQAITMPATHPVLFSTSPRRKPKSKQRDVSSVSRCSARLAKKACNHVLVVAVAQNVLMRKLGIAKDQHVESDNFEAYLKLFMDGLSKEQVWMIKELFAGAVPDMFLAEGVEA